MPANTRGSSAGESESDKVDNTAAAIAVNRRLLSPELTMLDKVYIGTA